MNNLNNILYFLLEEELDEQNALAAGNVTATSTGLGLDARKFRSPAKEKVNEVNSIRGFIAASSLDSNQNTPFSGEEDLHDKKKNISDYSPTHDTMWNYGDKPTGDIPVSHIKYVAILEETSNSINESVAKNGAKKLSIICDQPLKPKSIETIVDFIKFCNRILKIDNIPKIYLHQVKKPEMTTGMYRRDNNTMHVLVGKRLVVDVLRTIAHELTHRRQDETGLLDKHLANVDPMNEMGDIDTIYENEAYTLAGNIVKIFCRKYPKISKEELYQLSESRKRQ